MGPHGRRAVRHRRDALAASPTGTIGSSFVPAGNLEDAVRTAADTQELPPHTVCTSSEDFRGRRATGNRREN